MNDDLKIEYIMSVEKSKIMKEIYDEGFNDFTNVEIVKEESSDDIPTRSWAINIKNHPSFYIMYEYIPLCVESVYIVCRGTRKYRSILVGRNDLREYSLNKLDINE
jgi:hypothetical protein